MVSASTSLSNEEATTHTDSEGINFSMTAGYMFLGPTVTATGGYNKDWSDSLMKAVSTSETNTISKTLSFNIGIVPGADFNRKYIYTRSLLALLICLCSVVYPIAQVPVIQDDLQWC